MLLRAHANARAERVRRTSIRAVSGKYQDEDPNVSWKGPS